MAMDKEQNKSPFFIRLQFIDGTSSVTSRVLCFRMHCTIYNKKKKSAYFQKTNMTYYCVVHITLLGVCVKT